MTGGVGANVGPDVGAATGSDFDVGVADPLHPTSARIVSINSKRGATRHRGRFSPMDIPLLISILYAAMPAELGVAALVPPGGFWTSELVSPASSGLACCISLAGPMSLGQSSQ